ncbi:DUF2238 domain-containing protein [Streptomyces sp. C184]|uniref:DUF2238 domain-containing protein n=1 Tax=Streptomyces sp. C184 TaxID=3237121 RepID=UPI0034C5E66A
MLSRYGGVLLAPALWGLSPHDRPTWLMEARGAADDAFLATQGDRWDTRWDMACALLGAVVSLLLLSRLHGRQLARYGIARARTA